MNLKDFDYHLPQELIAQYPAEHREDSRLLVLSRSTGAINHTLFKNIADYLVPGDLLVLNNTRVFPARLHGRRADTGGAVEVMLLEEKEPGLWEALVRPGRKAREGLMLLFGQGELTGEILERTESGGRLIRFSLKGNGFWREIFRLGEVPLPPYIRRKAGELDKERYQTVYAQTLGSVAAPTAGLHFTAELLRQLEAAGVELVYVLLHVGLGTFRPVREEVIEEHKMHAEFWRVEPEAAARINQAKAAGRRVIAVGTTSVRVLESAAGEDGRIGSGEGWTSLFIYPGYRFRVVDGLFTNFHLPCSTLLMLVSAFAGREKVLNAYQQAVALKYRFFSYGDAMLIL